MPIVAQDRKEYQINVRLSRAEYKAAQQGAAREHRTMADYLRRRLITPLTQEEEAALNNIQTVRETLASVNKELSRCMDALFYTRQELEKVNDR